MLQRPEKGPAQSPQDALLVRLLPFLAVPRLPSFALAPFPLPKTPMRAREQWGAILNTALTASNGEAGAK